MHRRGEDDSHFYLVVITANDGNGGMLPRSVNLGCARRSASTVQAGCVEPIGSQSRTRVIRIFDADKTGLLVENADISRSRSD